jgi:calcineurin-like phosphoesterase family protein
MFQKTQEISDILNTGYSNEVLDIRNKMFKQSNIQVHGHMHWINEHRFGNGKQFDCGMDGNNLFPYSMEELLELLKDRYPHPLTNKPDHHV